MIIFNSFAFAFDSLTHLTRLHLPTITILARNDRTGGHRVFSPTNKTFGGICLALVGKFLQNKL